LLPAGAVARSVSRSAMLQRLVLVTTQRYGVSRLEGCGVLATELGALRCGNVSFVWAPRRP